MMNRITALILIVFNIVLILLIILSDSENKVISGYNNSPRQSNKIDKVIWVTSVLAIFIIIVELKLSS